MVQNATALIKAIRPTGWCPECVAVLESLHRSMPKSKPERYSSRVKNARMAAIPAQILTAVSNFSEGIPRLICKRNNAGPQKMEHRASLTFMVENKLKGLFRMPISKIQPRSTWYPTRTEIMLAHFENLRKD